MCNPRRIQVTATRSIAEAWEREVRRAVSLSTEVRGEVRVRQPLAPSIGAPALAALERALDAGAPGWSAVGDVYRYDVAGGYALYSMADRSLTIVATRSEEVEVRAEASELISGRVEDEVRATGVGTYYHDGYGGANASSARRAAESQAAEALDRRVLERIEAEVRAAEATIAGDVEARAEQAAQASLGARAASRREALQREAAAAVEVIGLEARRAFNTLLARAYRDALLALARHRGAQGVHCSEEGDVLEIEFVLPG